MAYHDIMDLTTITSVGAFWEPRQRRGHSLHEVSYRACFKPELPAHFIGELTKPGDTVLDPFAGRGTTVLQAALMGRRGIGNDINPLSSMLVMPRLAPPTLCSIDRRLREIPLERRALDSPELLTFFHPQTLADIEAFRRYLHARSEAGQLDSVDAWLRMVAVNRLTGHSSGFLSGYTLPPNQAASLVAQERINARYRPREGHPYRDLTAVLRRKSAALLRSPARPELLDHAMLCGPADELGLHESSVDLVVTSPPFLDVVDYAGDNWLRGWFVGIPTASLGISMPDSVATWQEMMRGALAEMARVVRPGGHVVVEVGEVRHGSTILVDTVATAAESLPLLLQRVMVNRGAFTKTAHIWGVTNNTGGTNSNRVLVFARA